MSVAPHDVRQAPFTGAGVNTAAQRHQQLYGVRYHRTRNQYVGTDAAGQLIPDVRHVRDGRGAAVHVKNKLFAFATMRSRTIRVR